MQLDVFLLGIFPDQDRVVRPVVVEHHVDRSVIVLEELPQSPQEAPE